LQRREELVKSLHAGWTGGHVGLRKTLDRVQQKAYWWGWKADVEKVIAKCENCAQYHRGTVKRQAPLQTPMVGDVMDRISIDITGPHPTSRNGFRFILTALNNFSKWAWAFPIRSHDAITVANQLVDQIFSVYGTPIQILSDRGPEFEGELMAEMCRVMEIDKIRTTSYKASTNGQVERFHRTLNSLLGKVVAENQKDWCERLPAVMAAYRASRHESTGYTPNLMMLGREVRTPVDLVYGRPDDQPRSYADFVEHKVKVLESAYGTARRELGVTAEREKKYYDLRVRPKLFKKCDWVWYYYPRRRVGRSPKWQRLYTGPYLIVEEVGPVNLKLQRSARSLPFVVHRDKVKKCYGDHPSSWLEDPDEGTVEFGEEAQNWLENGMVDENTREKVVGTEPVALCPQRVSGKKKGKRRRAWRPMDVADVMQLRPRDSLRRPARYRQ